MASDEVVVPGYTLTSIICEAGPFAIFRALSLDNVHFLVKVPLSPRPPAAVIAELEREYETARELDSAFVVRPVRIERYAGTLALILEDFDCHALATELAAPLDLERFFRIAISITGALAALHRQGVVHKDLKPENIFLGGGSGDSIEVKLTGFGTASRVFREHQAPYPPEFVAGTLAYMAPEQTGRMNRSVDSRSDLYSLGVILYQVLTGRLPFTASDPLEWFHCHIAIQPPPPSQYRADAPQPLPDIIMKLLAKNAEDRYQTAEGLKADLERCAAEWRAAGRSPTFPLGEQDIPDRLLIPEKLYGRESEVEGLLAAFGRVAADGKPELVLVSGYSGVGKSALVNELHKVLVPKRGLFASGKFDQYKRGIPYSTLAQAFAHLILPLLGKSEAELEDWRQALKEALGLNGQLIVDLVPDLKLVIGEQPAVPDLEPQQAKARFQLVFRRFLGVFARPEHPLVLFLDDLQWLDDATLLLIEDLLTQADVRHLLLIGAYRDNEVDPTHPLMRMLNDVRNAGAPVQEIKLAPLDLEDLIQLIADSLFCEHERAASLAHIVQAKTGGNPFFAIQFLSALDEAGLVAFDRGKGRWSWDLQRIEAMGYTDNVADLMASRVALLPCRTRDALQQLACLGTAAESSMLSRILGMTEEGLDADLQAAIDQGFVLRLKGAYRFTHDRMHEAAYALIPETSRPEAHLRIGRLLAAQTPPERLEEVVFEIASQFNRGLALIGSHEEREELAELNLIAGRRAKASAAYSSALTYLATGAALLPDDVWERRHELAFTLELLRAECEFLTGALSAAEEHLKMLSDRTADLVELAAVTCLQEDLFTTLGRSDRGVEVALDYLRRAGIVWSAHPERSEVEREYKQIWRQLGDRTIEALGGLAPATDPLARGTLDVLAAAMAPALFTDQNLYFALIGSMAKLSLEHGNSDGACIAYAMLGSVLGPHFGEYEAGFRFGKLAVDLVEEHGLSRFKARVYMMAGAHIIPWTRPIRTGRRLLRGAIDAAKEAGDLTYVAFSGTHFVTHLLACGDPLGDVQREAEAGLDFARRARFGLVADRMTAKLRLILTLRGQTPDFGSFDGGGFDEGQFERHLAGDPRLALAACWYSIRKLQARFFAGDYASAIEAAANAERLLWTSATVFERAEYNFYAALARVAVLNTASAAERSVHLKALADHCKQLENWAEHCPENFGNRAALVSAEIARVEGRPLDAERLYERAIESASANGFVQNEALANELAGRFYLDRGLKKNGLAHLLDARACYALWEADGKVKQLDRLYPQLGALQTRLTARDTGTAPPQMDAATVARASQAVSGEIELPKLIETLMTIALENAGADRGLLILPHGRGFEVEVEADAGVAGVQVRLTRAAIAEAECPATIVNYVIRTQKSVILDDASRPGEFFEDVYLRRGTARSLLCLPLLRQGKLTGVLYLENSQAAGAFTPDRIAVLDVLATQAAISLENARLYDDLRESEAKYRRIVDTATEGIWALGPDLRTTFVNARMAEMLGYSSAEMIGRPLTDFMYEKDMPDYLRRMDARRQGLAESYERRFRRKDGQTVWVLVSAAPILDDEHRFNGAFAMHTDITERRRAVEELQRYRDQLEDTVQQRTAELLAARDAAEAANRAKSMFLANMSHELRTPLNAILGFTSLMRREPDVNAGQRERLDIVNRSGEYLLTLINDVLEMAKIEAGRVQLDIAPFDLGGMIRDVADVMRLRAEEKGLRLVLDQSSEFPRYIKGDEGRLRQILMNLVGNAVKFTAEGGVTIRLGTKANARQHLLIEVEDTGPGINRQDQNRLFQPFVQLAKWDEQKGTGLGLAITRHFVELMSGTVGVESTPGKGSVFRVDLPLELADESEIAGAREVARAKEVRGLAPGQPAWRILIVDDEPDHQMLLYSLMTGIGLEAKVAPNGEEAVKIFEAWQPHLIWMDRRMPVMDGVEATRRIRRLSHGKDVKIVAVTASVFKEQQKELFDAGMDDLVRKPYRFEEIYDCLARHLGAKYVFRQAAAGEEAGEAAEGAGVTPAMLAVLPEDLRQQLHDALVSLDSDRIAAAIDEAGNSDPALVRSLRRLAENFDYPAILQALNADKG